MVHSRCHLSAGLLAPRFCSMSKWSGGFPKEVEMKTQPAFCGQANMPLQTERWGEACLLPGQPVMLIP